MQLRKIYTKKMRFVFRCNIYNKLRITYFRVIDLSSYDVLYSKIKRFFSFATKVFHPEMKGLEYSWDVTSMAT